MPLSDDALSILVFAAYHQLLSGNKARFGMVSREGVASR